MIQIPSNFNLSKSAPLDSRNVVANQSAKDSITYKYVGMQVYQQDVGKFYIWTGATYSLFPNGIYSGSGSLVGNTVIGASIIGNNTGSQSYALSLQGTDNDGSNVQLTSSFQRNTTGTNYLGISPTIQMNYANSASPSNFSTGPYINFNPVGTNFGDFSIGTNVGTNTSEKFRVTNNGNVGINSSNPKGVLDIHQPNVTGLHSIVVSNMVSAGLTSATIGYNTYITYPNTYNVFSATHGSSFINFDNLGQFSIYARTAGGPTSGFVQTFLSNANNTGIRVDASAHAWDGNVAANIVTSTLGNYVNNTEHYYSKLQTTNYYDLTSNTTDSGYPGYDGVSTLLITNDANYIDIEVNPNFSANNIQIDRGGGSGGVGGAFSDLQMGAELNIRFFQTPLINPSDVPFYLILSDYNNTNGSSISSPNYNDSLFGGSASTLTIQGFTGSNTTWNGDLFTFIYDGNGQWSIKSSQRIGQSQTFLQTTTHSVSAITLGQIYYYNISGSTYKFSSYTGSTVISATSSTYNKYVFATSSQTSYNSVPTLHIHSDNINAAKLSGNVLASVSASYVTASNLIWRIGKINNTSYYPYDNSNWAPVKDFVYDNNSNSLGVSGSVVSVDTLGNIFYYTTLLNNPTASATTLKFNINIPGLHWFTA